MTDKKVGIIGYGSMGNMLLNGFLDTKTVLAPNLFVSTRNNETVQMLTNNGVVVCSSNQQLVKECDIVYICVKPFEIKDLLIEIQSDLTIKKHLVSIAGSLSIENIGKIHKGKISRFLPTFISTVREGVTLVAHNEKVSLEDKEILEDMLSSISTVKSIPENEFEFVSELTSCAPGLIAAMFKEYVNVAITHTNLVKNEVRNLVIKTLFGTSKLLNEVNPNFDDTVARVATKGGATEVGVLVLESKIPAVFEEVFNKTLERQRMRKQKIDEQFNFL
jgi:pyrroline-5-carboxylate reductase